MIREKDIEISPDTETLNVEGIMDKLFDAMRRVPD